MLAGWDGADTLVGGPGYAARRYAVAVTLDGARNDGADPNRNGVSTAEEEGDLITAVEDVTGGDGADRLSGPSGFARNVLLGGPGNDWIDGGQSADTIDGQDGTDTVSYAARTARVAVRLDGVRNDGADPNGDGVSAAGEENDLVLGTENATGGSGADLLIAPGPEVNVLTGGPGGDLLDTVDGSEAADRLSCGYGADSYRADPSDTRQSCETAVP